MWILHICHSYYPPFLDCARQYCALFKGTPYKVLTVYLTGDEDMEVAEKTESDEVIFLGYKSKQVKGLKLGAIAQIKRIVKERDFAFCVAHRVKPTYIALLATRLPVISVHHNYNDYQRWSRRILVNFYKKRLLMLGVSNDVRDDLRNDLSGWQPERIQTLYNHIDVLHTRKQMQTEKLAREALSLPKHAYIIANVGRLHYDKDQATLLHGYCKALPNLPESALLYIAGKGPLEANLKKLANELGIADRIIFSGHVTDIKRYFKAFNLFALTSDREPFGMVLLEAMAAELPIICSDCGGGAEVVQDVGELFEFGNANRLSDILGELASPSFSYDTSQALHVLQSQFSDSAVRTRFWSLPFVSSLANQ